MNDRHEMEVLALNSGSSSLKFGLYRVGSTRAELLVTGEAESIGDPGGKLSAKDAHGNSLLSETASLPSQKEAIARIGKLLADTKQPSPKAIGHRIVHGGPKLRQHCIIDDTVLDELKAATAFAPLHTPSALAVIRFAQEHFPGLPQAACFDTTFHAAMPDVARVLPIPKVLLAEGIQRYGFHGLSCESILHQLGSDPPRRLVIAHLGNGASVTAVRDGKSIDTSMGLTPTGGIIMGTRTGDLDPGVLVYLMREKKFDAAKIEDLVDHRSGLQGISGIGHDMRGLHEAAATNPDARLAISMFCYSVRKQIAAMIGALGGVDMIVFAGGIGEHDDAVRAEICDNLPWISGTASGCSVRVIPSQEDEQIARHSFALSSAAPR
ncbi:MULTISPECIES: acetate/propionate family kinase [unclassified Acidisoma]|uniref:acetate/propionate family kinase n=1 Tax=unclassified Acidisoma TaxID=2634065 RepID=UPI001C2093B4|nr:MULTISPECIES: acetate/propionate family kinase [unclassified Acidisoma]